MPPCRSLCIIDEFGKGTLAADGVGFFCSVLRQFSRMQPPPKVIAATHFSEVFDEAYLARQALSALCNRVHHSLVQDLRIGLPMLLGPYVTQPPSDTPPKMRRVGS